MATTAAELEALLMQRSLTDPLLVARWMRRRTSGSCRMPL